MKNNLSDKAFWEFKKGDSLYVFYTPKGEKSKLCFLAEIYSTWRNNATVKILEALTNPTLWENKIKTGEHNHSHIKEKGWFADVRMKDCALYGKAEGDISERYHRFNAFGYAHKTLGLEVNEKRVEHPSFGVIVLSKPHYSSSAVPLFGSNLQHHSTVTIEIKKAFLDRHLNNDWIHGNQSVIEIEMSVTQFADFIMSAHQGGGTPCTIRHIQHESYPDPPFESRVDIFQREFENDMKNITTKLQTEVQEAFDILRDKPTLTKGDRKLIFDRFEQFISELKNSLPFVSQQFNESMEKVTSEAKGAIEAYFNTKISQLGIDAAQANPQLLLPQIDNNQK